MKYPPTINNEKLRIVAQLVVQLIEARHTHIKEARSTTHLDALFQSLSEGLILWNVNDHIEDYNSAALRILNLSEDQLTSAKMNSLLAHLSFSPPHTHPIEHVLKNHKSVENINATWTPGDSSSRHLRINAVPLTQIDCQQTTHILITFSDVTDHLKALSLAQYNENKFRSIFENAPMGIARFDSSRKHIEVNKAYAALMEYSEQELKSMTFLDLAHPDEKPLSLKLGSDIHSASYKFNRTRMRYITKSGKTICAQLSSCSVPSQESPDGYAILNVIEDISEQLKLENEITAAHAGLKMLIDTMNEGLFALDENGLVTEINKAALSIFGLNRDEIVGIKFHSFDWKLIREDEKPYSKNMTPIHLAQTEFLPQHAVIVGLTNSKDEFHWLSVDAIPIQIDRAKPPGVLVTFLNVTERIRLQREFQNELTLRKEILDSASYIVIATDSNGIITSFNATAEKSLGYKAQEVVGTKSPGIFHDPFEMVIGADELATQLNISVEANFEVFSLNAQVYGRYEREWTFIRKNGTQFPGFLSVTTLRNSKGEITGYLGISHDLTEEKKLRENLERQRLSMASTSKMAALGEMAGGIAHEINNPLTIIYGKADYLYRQIQNDAFPKERILEDIQKIKMTSERIAKIVKGLRTFSRSGEADPFQRVLIDNVINETLAFCSERFRNLNVKLEIVSNGQVELECRSTQLSQVILNLLNNAFDAVQELPEKWVKLEFEKVDNDQVQISVTDSGGGIPANVIDKLMQPFFTTKEVGKGTGLGLSVSQGIIQDHFGTLEVDRKCKNTRFVIRLPLQHKKLQKEAA